MEDDLKTIVEYLKQLANRRVDLPSGVVRVQKLIWNADDKREEGPQSSPEDPRWELLRDLAYDLNYYEPDPALRIEDASYFGNERAINEINEVLSKFDEL
jgi:hypothetical protein